ncbi:MAG: 5-amino-6-(D-ribitylamino)uracil--L-tyrosine 4-hydroxyphenyl transferase CofH [Methermicoccaceae archaeon]
MCIQGGLHPNINMEYYCELLERINENYPEIHIHAFSPMEVFYAAERSGMEINDALRCLKKSGLGSMPGTAAEILVDDVRKTICPKKLSTDQWVEVIETAHKIGIPSTATMMYGHIESWRDRLEHILLIRDIQKRTGGFTEFVPLPFMAGNNEIGRAVGERGGTIDLRVYAISRILLNDVIPNLQASWVKLGKKLAQVTLMFGANDVGGTLMEENISKSAGGTAGECMRPKEIINLINEIGRKAVRRDTLYNPLPPLK